MKQAGRQLQAAATGMAGLEVKPTSATLPESTAENQPTNDV